MTDLVKDDEGRSDKHHRERIGAGSDDGAYDEADDKPVGSESSEFVMIQKTDLDEGEQHNGQLETQPDAEHEQHDEGEVIGGAPFVGTEAKPSGELNGHFDGDGHQKKITERDTCEKQAATNENGLPDKFFLPDFECWEYKFADEIDHDGRGDNQSAKKGEFQCDHESLDGAVVFQNQPNRSWNRIALGDFSPQLQGVQIVGARILYGNDVQDDVGRGLICESRLNVGERGMNERDIFDRRFDEDVAAELQRGNAPIRAVNHRLPNRMREYLDEKISANHARKHAKKNRGHAPNDRPTQILQMFEKPFDGAALFVVTASATT